MQERILCDVFIDPDASHLEITISQAGIDLVHAGPVHLNLLAQHVPAEALTKPVTQQPR